MYAMGSHGLPGIPGGCRQSTGGPETAKSVDRTGPIVAPRTGDTCASRSKCAHGRPRSRTPPGSTWRLTRSRRRSTKRCERSEAATPVRTSMTTRSRPSGFSREPQRAMRYKGCDIGTMTVHGPLGKITEVAYFVHKGGVVVHAALLPGPFDTAEDARAAAEWAARGWIDQQGK